MDNLFASSLLFAKLAQIEKEPDTEREPQFLDEQLQAYEFIGFLNILAQIKNQLGKVKELSPIFEAVFSTLVKLRPGTIKNAINGMLETKTFDKAVYIDLRDAVLKDIESTNLKDRLEALIEVIDVELLDSEELANNENGQIMKSVKRNAKKALSVINEGLRYI